MRLAYSYLRVQSLIYYDKLWETSQNVASNISNDNALGEGEKSFFKTVAERYQVDKRTASLHIKKVKKH